MLSRYARRLGLLARTICYLSARQVVAQAATRIAGRVRLPQRTRAAGAGAARPVILLPSVGAAESYDGAGGFTFLNRTHRFTREVDWEYLGLGDLWRYNLNYFDFLNQEQCGCGAAVELMRRYASRLRDGTVCMEPYPVSLRIMNWVKYLSRERVHESVIDESLAWQAAVLSRRLEYHLGGNHILENGFGLLFASYYLRDAAIYRAACRVLVPELRRQILPDGGHIEGSPMYHLIMLHRVLDSLNLVRNNEPPVQAPRLHALLERTSRSMLQWSEAMAFRDGSLPQFGDSAESTGPTLASLRAYAARLCVRPRAGSRDGACLAASGYRVFRRGAWEIVVDVGPIGPRFNPGHGHCDALSFELRVGGIPVVVDTGVSTYDVCERRLVERSTRSHNTVTIGRAEQSEVWDSFRVGRRARVWVMSESGHGVCGSHDGYKALGATHTRSFRIEEETVTIEDRVSGRWAGASSAHLHFPPRTDVSVRGEAVRAGPVSLSFAGAERIRQYQYLHAPGYNRLVPSVAVRVDFAGGLVTRITA